MLLVDLNELLRVVDLFLEQNKIGHLADEIVADANLRKFGALVKLGVVHAERDDLFIVDDRD